MSFPLPPAAPETVGLDPVRLAKMCAVIERHVAEGLHPGAQIAVARHGKLALFESFGQARTAPAPAATSDETLFLLYSNTKVVTACAVWTLVEDGAIRFGDRVADHLPGFEKHRKGDITLIQLLSHQGGFPTAAVPPEVWNDHDLLRRVVCDFVPEWPAGQRLQYHATAAHWVAGAMIEAVTGQDFRTYIRDKVIAPLGLGAELFVGLPDAEHARAADMHEPDGAGGVRNKMPECSAAHRMAGVPGGGGYASARAMAAFYQMLVQGGQLGGTRIVSPRLLRYVTQNFTGERLDLSSGMPMHRGLGPYVRGTTETVRGMGALAHPGTFGHGGAGSSYCWGDPDSGVSMSFLSNCRLAEEDHDLRMEVISNMVHAAIVG
ncbi:MAG: serine hydrolase [Alphaproteobacteria bacterium]|nr:serine hydrolase [Alphaproteobacteria bacterium]